MFTSINRTVFDIPLTWDRTRFEASRAKCRQARKLIETSINAQYNKQLKDVFFQKLDIENNIHESQERLLTQEKKVRVLDNLIEVAAESLPDYFDKRMENARTAIQEHCNAIKQILREENEHWKEIHTAIDQNLITTDDIHPPIANVDQENISTNIHTIDEVDEEEQTSKLLNNKTVTPLLTQMIRKSRLRSIRSSIIEPTNPPSIEEIIQSKQERFSVMVPLASTRRTLPVIDTTFVVKLEESRNTEANTSRNIEANTSRNTEANTSRNTEANISRNIEANTSRNTEANKSHHTEVIPIESLPSSDVVASPSYSQPKPPARLYFSPTLLQDDEESDPEPIQPVLSTIDQNQTNTEKPKAIPRRFGQTFLLDNIKAEEINKTQDIENIRPKISDEIPFVFQPDPTLLPEEQSFDKSHHSPTIQHQKSVIYTKRRTRAVAAPEIESESLHNTRRAGRKPKQPEEIITTKRQPRKRKLSVAEDGNNNTVALRKKKAAPAKTTTRKTRVKKTKEVPIREPSPLPIIDRSKHYSTRFSTRSHRSNNLTLSTTTIFDDHKKNKSKNSSTRLRAKSMGRIRNQADDGDEQPILKTRSTLKKTQPKTRAKSMMATRNRRK